MGETRCVGNTGWIFEGMVVFKLWKEKLVPGIPGGAAFDLGTGSVEFAAFVVEPHVFAADEGRVVEPAAVVGEFIDGLHGSSYAYCDEEEVFEDGLEEDGEEDREGSCDDLAAGDSHGY